MIFNFIKKLKGSAVRIAKRNMNEKNIESCGIGLGFQYAKKRVSSSKDKLNGINKSVEIF